jgi:hypothetical protein
VTLLLVLAGVAWTRLPDKHVWQVLFSLLVPLLLVIAALALEAGTMRALTDDDGKRVKLVLGAATLLVWVAVVWVCWAILDWCDDEIPLWAGYLNSRASAHWRATMLTYEHIQLWLALLVRVLRWIVVPAKVIPYAMASAQWAWRLPFRRVLRLLWNWRWWTAVALAALLSAALPGRFFAGAPHGTVAHQVWAVVLKLAGTYLLAVVCWVLLLAWAAVLLSRQAQPAEDALDRQLLQRLCAGRIWIAGLAIWTLLSGLSDFLTDRMPENLKSSGWITVPLILVLLVSLLFLQVALMRSMIGPDEKRATVVWGAFIPLAWTLPGLAAAILLARFHSPTSVQDLCWVLIPGMLIPFFAASAQWGARLPWRKVLRVLRDWRWWLGVVTAAIVGMAIPNLLVPDSSGAFAWPQTEIHPLRTIVSDVLSLFSWVVLMGWLAVLLTRARPGASAPDDDALVTAPVNSGPVGADSVSLPLSEGGDDSGGKA